MLCFYLQCMKFLFERIRFLKALVCVWEINSNHSSKCDVVSCCGSDFYPLTINNVNRAFMSLFFICIFLLQKCLFRFIFHFNFAIIFLLLGSKNYWYTLVFHQQYDLQIFYTLYMWTLSIFCTIQYYFLIKIIITLIYVIQSDTVIPALIVEWLNQSN